MSIAENLMAQRLPVNELIAVAVKQAKYADQDIGSETAELTFEDFSVLRLSVALVEPATYELCFFSGDVYNDSYSEASENGAVYHTGFMRTAVQLRAMRKQLETLQMVIDMAENCINSHQSELVHVFVNVADPSDMIHYHDFLQG